MDIIIRSATLNDRTAIVELAKTHSDTRSFGMPWYSGNREFRNNTTRIVVAVDSTTNEIVGFYEAKYLRTKFEVILRNIIVKEECRGKNIGAKLLDDLVEDTEQVRRGQIRFKLGVHNKRARKFFLSHGFVMIAQINNQWQMGRKVREIARLA